MTPAENAATVREALDCGVPLLHREDRLERRARADAALDALEAQAETDKREHERLAEYKEQADRAYAACYERKDEYMRRMEAAEAERDRWKENAEIARAAADTLAARVEELEAALREAEGWLTQGQGSPECHYALGIIRAALDKDTA